VVVTFARSEALEVVLLQEAVTQWNVEPEGSDSNFSAVVSRLAVDVRPLQGAEGEGASSAKGLSQEVTRVRGDTGRDVDGENGRVDDRCHVGTATSHAKSCIDDEVVTRETRWRVQRVDQANTSSPTFQFLRREEAVSTVQTWSPDYADASPVEGSEERLSLEGDRETGRPKERLHAVGRDHCLLKSSEAVDITDQLHKSPP
jgi:hypothetical protein